MTNSSGGIRKKGENLPSPSSLSLSLSLSLLDVSAALN